MSRAVAQLIVPTQLADATVVCGCGGGTAVRDVLPTVLHHAQRLVLDADGLNAVAAEAALRRALRARAARGLATVLTPHPLEAARLLDAQSREVQTDRLQAARQLADAMQCTVLLKGSGTVVAAPGATTSINPTGDARLATAGSGDVLAGAIVGMRAQGLAAFEAALVGGYLHGLAGELARESLGDAGVVAGDLAAMLPLAIRRLKG
jgi:hydroxyethylthiazole kinase-like uncharacterized protein yjeF